MNPVSSFWSVVANHYGGSGVVRPHSTRWCPSETTVSGGLSTFDDSVSYGSSENPHLPGSRTLVGRTDGATTCRPEDSSVRTRTPGDGEDGREGKSHFRHRHYRGNLDVFLTVQRCRGRVLVVEPKVSTRSSLDSEVSHTTSKV